MIRRPTYDQIGIGLDWLRSNEGDNGEAEACKAVADWIEAIERDAKIKSLARQHKVPVKALRNKLEALRK